MSVANTHIVGQRALAPPIERKLRGVRAWSLALGLAAAAMVATGVLVLVALVSMLIDGWTSLENAPWRPLMSGAPWLAALATLGVGVVAVVRRDRALVHAAGRVDRATPGLDERWTSLTRVCSESNGDAHPAMYRKLADESVAWAPEVEPSAVAPKSRLTNAAWVLAPAIGLLALFAAWDPAAAMVRLERFLLPGSQATLTRLEAAATDQAVARGESATLGIAVHGRRPTRATLEIRAADGDLREISLKPHAEAGAVTHTVRDVREPFECRWTAGDARSEWLQVAVADRPRIAAMLVRVTPPSYTKRPIVEKHELPRRLRVVQGSELHIAVRPAEGVETCELLMGRGKESWSVQLEPTGDGWYGWDETIERSLSIEPRLTETHGLTNLHAPRGHIHAFADRAPSVEVVSPSDEMAVQPDEEVEIVFRAKDDFAVTHAELVVTTERVVDGNVEQTVDTIPIDLGEQAGAKEVRGSVPLDLAEYELESGESLSYAVRVYDNRQMLQAESRPPDESVPASAPAPSDSTPPSPTQLANSADATRPDPTSATERNLAADRPEPTKPTGASPEPAEPQPRDGLAAAEPRDDGEDKPEESSLIGDSVSGFIARLAPGEDAALESEPGADPRADAPESAPNSDRVAPPPAEAPKLDPGAMAAADDQPQPSAGSPGQKTDQPIGDASDLEESQPRLADRPSTPDSIRDAARRDQMSDASAAEAQAASAQPATADPPTRPESDDPASTTSREQRLVANAEEPPESTSDPADSSATRNSLASASEDPPSEGGSGQPRAGETPDVAVPEGMVAQESDPNRADRGELRSEEQQAAGAAPPADPMTRRMLDVGSQSASSQRMRITVDEWAGTFDGQRREKLAIAISPVLEKLKKDLAAAQELTGGVADRLEIGQAWAPSDARALDRADRLLEGSEKAVEGLRRKTDGTPYAFVGLELGSIVTTHSPPAREAVWEALETRSVDAASDARVAWSEIATARKRLDELMRTFDRIHREHRLAEATKRIEKMYRVYVEDALAILQPQRDQINRYERRRAEFELDEEYLERLKEVLEMRRDMQAELARMLADDPRLMRRLLDRLQGETDTLRDQMTLLAERQKAIAREAAAWSSTTPEERPALLRLIRLERRSRAAEIAELATLTSERFEAWTPFGMSLDDPSLAEPRAAAKRVVSAAQRLAAAGADDPKRIALGDAVYDSVAAYDAALRGVDVSGDRQALSGHLLNRLGEARKLTTLASSWVQQAKLIDAGDYWQEAAVEQYKLATETDALAGKLANLEPQLTSALPRDSEGLTTISEKTKQLLQTLDTEVSANQLSATFAMRRKREADAAAKSAAADAAFGKVEQLFDELMRATIDELDKLPVVDPIASLLEDPTLDELLAMLENEADLEELLGIPQRPSNLQIIGDWLNRGSGGSGGGGMNGMLGANLRQQNREARRRAREAYKKAIARALKEEEKIAKKPSKQPGVAKKRTEWNTLLSTLEDDLLQGSGRLPPPEYRRAIEYYLSRISRIRSEEDDQEPVE